MESEIKKKPPTAWVGGNEEKQDAGISEQDDAKVSQEVKQFFSETTAHGFGNIVKPESFLCYKITWAIIVITVLTGGMLHLSSVITSYLAYPSQETSEIIQDNPSFPDITICNAMPVSDSVARTYGANPNSEWNQYWGRLGGVRNELREHTQNDLPVQSLLQAPYGFFGTIDHEEIRNLSHTFENLILSCKHSGKSCEADDWVYFLDKDYFNCYTYVGGRNLKSAITGPSFGLSVILFLENIHAGVNLQYNVESSTENAFGARLVIHDHNTLPSPTQKGIEILPGQSTSIGLRESRIHKLSEPWGKCTQRSKLKHLEQYDYTTHSCMDLCMGMTIYDKCDCILGLVPDTLKNQDFRYCGLFDNATVTLPDFVDTTACVLGTLEDFGSGNLIEQCDCREKCEYRMFDHSISQSKWPATPFQLDFYREFVLAAENQEMLARTLLFSNYATWRQNFEEFNEVIYNNFARLNIYFESLDILERRQFPSMTITDMFANVGGTIGLWAGLSIVTIVEVVFLLIKLCGLGCKKCKRPNRKIGDSTTELQGAPEN